MAWRLKERNKEKNTCSTISITQFVMLQPPVSMVRLVRRRIIRAFVFLKIVRHLVGKGKKGGKENLSRTRHAERRASQVAGAGGRRGRDS